MPFHPSINGAIVVIDFLLIKSSPALPLYLLTNHLLWTKQIYTPFTYIIAKTTILVMLRFSHLLGSYNNIPTLHSKLPDRLVELPLSVQNITSEYIFFARRIDDKSYTDGPNLRIVPCRSLRHRIAKVLIDVHTDGRHAGSAAKKNSQYTAYQLLLLLFSAGMLSKEYELSWVIVANSVDSDGISFRSS